MTSQYHKAKRLAGAAIRASAPMHTTRFPRKFGMDEIATMPRIAFTEGVGSGAFISREREGSRYFSVGISFHEPGCDDVVWQETSWDEAFYCIEGRLFVTVTDAEGDNLRFTLERGDHFWAPAGYKYRVGTAGAAGVTLFITAPQMPSGWRYTGDDESYSDQLIGLRADSRTVEDAG